MGLEAWKTDQIYLNIVYLGYNIYPDIINHIVMKNDELNRVEGGYSIYFMFTIKLAPATT